MLSIRMHPTVLVFRHFDQEEPNASSVFGELKAEFTFSCQGKDVLIATNKKK